MAYSPKSDINEIAYLKRQYNKYKANNDTEGMQFAQDSAKKYYDSLIGRGYTQEASYLQGADAKTAFDYSKTYDVQKKVDKANNYYDSFVDTYKDNVKSAQEGAISAANAKYDAGKLAVDNTFKDTAKAYYNQYLKEKKALPQELAALGITGGAAESSLIELGNNYLGNLNQAQMQKNQAIADLEAQKAGVLADAEMNRANAENDIARLAYEKMLGDRDFDMAQRQYVDNSWLNTQSFEHQKDVDNATLQQSNDSLWAELDLAYKNFEHNKAMSEAELAMNQEAQNLQIIFGMAEMGNFELLANYLSEKTGTPITAEDAKKAYSDGYYQR